MITVDSVSKVYGKKSQEFTALDDVSFEVPSGTSVAIVGKSGSGKSTLMHVMSGLDRATDGTITIDEQDISELKNKALDKFRAEKIGFIFQAHNLHNSLTAVQNVQMGLQIHGRHANRNWRDACLHMLALVGLSDRADFMPDQLSGGQKQRVAVARAIVGNPDVVFADEPTAALDKDSGHNVVRLLRRLADERKTTIFMVTHDHRVLDFADRIIKMEDGRVVEEKSKNDIRNWHIERTIVGNAEL